jgi:hypothetical protein
MERKVSTSYVPLRMAVAKIYRTIVGPTRNQSVADIDRALDRVAHAVALVVPLYAHDAKGFGKVPSADLLDCTFVRGAMVLLTTQGTVVGDLLLQRDDIPAAISVLKAARVQFRPSDIEDTGEQDLLDLVAKGGTTDEVLNALVCEARRVSEEDTRVAVFIADPEAAQLNFAAAAGLSERYTQAVDGFAIGPNQPSCGKAAYIGEAVIVGDVATDTNWSPYLQLAQEHGIRACWSFPLHSSDGGLLGTFALYRASPSEPNARQYKMLRYFSSVATLVLERHRSASKAAPIPEFPGRRGTDSLPRKLRPEYPS